MTAASMSIAQKGATAEEFATRTQAYAPAAHHSYGLPAPRARVCQRVKMVAPAMSLLPCAPVPLRFSAKLASWTRPCPDTRRHSGSPVADCATVESCACIMPAVYTFAVRGWVSKRG